MRLAVLGNSHLAAFKLGWDALAAAGDPLSREVSPVFFGAPREGLKHIRHEGGVIVPTRKDIVEGFERMSGGHRDIRLAEYDAVLLVGLNVNIKRVLRFYRSHVWFGMAGVEGKCMVPRRFMREFLTERFGDTLLVNTVAKLREGTSAPIVAVAEPFWASWVRNAEERGDAADYGWDDAIRAGDAPALGEVFRETVSAALAGRAVLVPQPPETVQDSILTRVEFNKDASRLISGEGGGTDAAHMNGEFGRVIWPLAVAAARTRPAVAA